MRKKLLFIIVTLFLVACGQSVEEEATKPSIEDHSAEAVAKDDSLDEKKEKEEEEEEETEKTTTTALDELKIHYIDANQADATLFEYKDGDTSYTILYDTGDWNRNDVVNYLDQQEVSFIDLLIISHPHADHDGQLVDIMNAYDVGEVWLSGNTNTSQTFQRGLEAVLDSDADYHEPRAGETYDIGPLEIEILHPESLTGNLNEDSISLLFTYGDKRFIFTGDAYQNEERLMMKRTDVQADIIQLGHHGSNTSSDPTFIKAVDPDVAIYSAGENNSYGHPHPDVVSFIQGAGITLYGTDVHGTILITTDGKEYSVSTKEDGTISPESTGSSSKKTSKEKEKKDVKSGDCVDINNASLDKLEAIIHIGPARAEGIVSARPFNSIDDLTKVDGLGPARIADIKSEGVACVK